MPATGDDIIDAIARLASGGSYYDFASVGSSSLRRRIERRQRRLGVTSQSQYLATLQRDAGELESLRAALLGTGIWLFRDPGTWEFVERRALPAILGLPQRSRPVRVWVPFCGMGADAYSLSILLLEQASRHKFQVFASDADDESLAQARVGRFPWIAGTEGARLRHFLVATRRGLYQVNRTLRESVVFARHDLLSDLPFSHIDLICCRHVLTHLTPAARRVATEAFAHALDDGGYLVLSPMEQPDRDVGAFDAVSRGWGVYQRVARPPRVVRLTARPTAERAAKAIPSPTLPPHAELETDDGSRVAELLRLVTTGNLATTLAHDLSQPLGAIANLLHAAAIRVQGGAPSAELLDLLRQSSAQADRAGRLVAHVRRLLHGGQRRIQRCDLRRLITSAVKVMHPTLHRHGIDLRLALGKVRLESDVCRVEIEQVVVNLIQNAIDALSTVPAHRCQIQVGTSFAPAGEARIIVADNGPGFAAGTEGRVFEPFFTTKATGLGMGLAICRATVTNHGGRLWAERMADRTLMCFTLPLARESHA
jgi:chemotaxis methyl-accepting protein methylase/signal transduction histidine kinase